MGLPIDHGPTHAANPLTAIMVKRDRVFALFGQAFIDHVEHFQERHIRVDPLRLIGFKSSRGPAIFLPPDL